MAFKTQVNSDFDSDDDGFQGGTSQPRSNTSGMARVAMQIVVVCAAFGLGFMILLNMQPWIDVADNAARSINVIPFQDSLTSIPYLGGLVLWVIVNLSKLLAIALWGLVNFLENLPFFLGTAFGQRVPPAILKDLNLYRAIAYLVEAIVCWVRYPTYVGGWDAVVADFPDFDPALIDWSQMTAFLLAIAGCEICVQVGIRLWSINQALKSAR